MGFLIGGGVLLLVGIILWIMKGKKEGKSAVLELADTSDVKDVNELWESMRNSMGDGSFTHFVEIKGVAYSQTPLTSGLSDTQCVYYTSKVVHEYENLENRKDSQGKMQKKWVKKTDTVSENKQWANGFGLKDDTGFIEIEPAKAELHVEQFYSNYEKGEPNKNSAINLKIGNFSLGIGQKNPSRRTIGYKYTESGIKMNTRLYVLGDANDRDGRLYVSKSQDKKQPFIVSTKSEDELVSGLGSAATGLKWGAFICWGLGAVGLVAGLLKMMSVF
ncbi:E3 ubiquitin ligase family protein [Crocinitomix catalasitica]|nr:E3 ubiquitin ligase family protein [Crocinitomix catalasitica]